MEQGPSVSTAVIARRLGLSAPALFHRFGSKEKLLIAAMCPDPSTMPLKALERPLDSRPIEEQLREIASEVTQFMRMIMPRIQVLQSAGVSPIQAWQHYETPPPLLLFRALSGWFKRASEAKRIRTCEPNHIAAAFMGSLHVQMILGMAGHPVHEPGAMDTYIDDLVVLLNQGLQTTQDTP
jgi:AcrR family transcriptional regulator